MVLSMGIFPVNKTRVLFSEGLIYGKYRYDSTRSGVYDAAGPTTSDNITCEIVYNVSHCKVNLNN